jgi:alanine or glycine:cation symporter, AGCS family
MKFFKLIILSCLLCFAQTMQAQAPVDTTNASATPVVDSVAKQEPAKGLDAQIDAAFKPIADAVGAVIFYSIPVSKDVKVPIVLIILIGGALFCTIYFGFPNVRLVWTAIKTVKGDFKEVKPDPNHKVLDDNLDTITKENADGEVSHFQALTAALSATVGLGNIAGVAVALSIGGPGATFWMIVAGFLGMASKFTECTLGVKYRDVDADGTVHGGPMYYLQKGFAEKGLAGLGKIFAVFFAIMCVGGSFGGGNMFQANQAAQQFLSTFGIVSSSGGFVFGVVIALLTALIIIGGIKRIATVTDKMVPFMAILYVGTGLIILAIKFADIPQAMGLILSQAFNPDPTVVMGGVMGAIIAGFKRAAFSNEAGVGSAAIAHSAVKTKFAASEGIVALLEPFIDTVIICTMSALVIVVVNLDANIMTYGQPLASAVGTTSAIFESVIPYSSYVLMVVVVLFAFSTMISWSYYGLQAWKYLFGKSKAADISYKVIFCIFTVIGASASLGAVIDFSDAMIFAMVFPNIIGLFVLAPIVKTEMKIYLAHLKDKFGYHK